MKKSSKEKQDQALSFEADLSELRYFVKGTSTCLLCPFDIPVSIRAAVAMRPLPNQGVLPHFQLHAFGDADRTWCLSLGKTLQPFR